MKHLMNILLLAGLFTSFNSEAVCPQPVITNPQLNVCLRSRIGYFAQYSPGNYNWTVTNPTVNQLIFPAGPAGSAVEVIWNSPGTQTLTVFCISQPSLSQTITVNVTSSAPPAPSAITQISGPSVMCIGQNTQASYSVSYQPGYTYIWKANNQVIPNENSNQLLNYVWTNLYPGYNNTLSCSLSDGTCIGPETQLQWIRSQQPLAAPPINGQIGGLCVGSKTTYSSYPENYNADYIIWNLSEGGILSNQTSNTVDITWTTTGSHTISAQGYNSCFGLGPISYKTELITIPPAAPTALTASPSSPCPGIKYYFSIDPIVGAQYYQWDAYYQDANNVWHEARVYENNGTNAVMSFPDAGTYALHVIANNGSCFGPAYNQSIVVKSPLSPIPTPTLGGVTMVCLGTSSVYQYISENLGQDYHWSTSSGGTILPGNQPQFASNVQWNSSGTQKVSIYYTDPGSGCTTSTKTIDVTVNAKPSMTSSSAKTICSPQYTYLSLAASGTNMLQWIATDNPNVTGESLTTQATNTINDLLTNTTTSVQTVNYTVTPSYVNGVVCVGDPQIITITVVPKAILTNTTLNACSGDALNFSLLSAVPSTFSWKATDNANTIGESTTIQTSSVINDVIINNTTSDQSIIYTVTPTSTAAGCVGSTQTVTIVVRPLPTAVASNQTICFASTTTIPITSNLPGTTFAWTATSTNVTGASSGSGSTITQTLNSADGINDGSVIYTITPTRNGCPGTPKTVTVSVAKSAQAVTFNPLASKTFGDPSFTLSAVSSSGLPITYTSSNMSVATVSGNTVTIVGGGTTDITANQVGSNCFSPAAPVVQTLTVNRLNQSIAFNLLASKTYGDAPFALTASSTSGLPVTFSSSNTSVAIISGNIVTIIGAGSTNITAIQAGNTNYNASTQLVRGLVVNKANQSITFNSLPSTVTCGSKYIKPALSNSGLSVTYTSSNPSKVTISGDTLKFIYGTGSVTITAVQAGNANYNAASPINKTVQLQLSTQTIVFDPLPNQVCINTTWTLYATSSSGLPISFNSSSQSKAQIINGNVLQVKYIPGTVTIVAGQQGNTCYNPVSCSQTIAIANSSCSSGGRIAADDQTNDIPEDEKVITAITAYPNPASKELTIQLPESAKEKSPIYVFDQLGKVIHEFYFNEDETIKTIDTRDFKEGLYILKLESGEQTIYQKVVIVHQE